MALLRFHPINSDKVPQQHFDRVYATRWDRLPLACDLDQNADGWQLSTDGDASVYVFFPWVSAKLGELVVQTTTLANRAPPYDLLTELARSQ